MSRRTSIVKALATKLQEINGEQPYNSNIYNNAFPYLKFWDEVQDFPSIYLTPGTEMRDYLPSDFTWGFLGVCVKLYCKGENATQDLENLLEDVERVIDNNRVLVYNQESGYETTEILITSITTDEGLLAPYAVGEINLQVRYQVM